MSTESPLMMDSRELSFDDLSEPMPDAPLLGGAGPFVINLEASSAPLELPTEDLSSGSKTYVYRIRRNEDGRVRYRLRLGPFAEEADANFTLSRVRQFYPSALTATALVEDLNAISVQQAKSGITRPVLEPVSTPPVAPVAPARTVPTLAAPATQPEEIIMRDASLDGGSIDLESSVDLDDAAPTIEALAPTEELALAAETSPGATSPGATSPATTPPATAHDDNPTRSMPAPALEFPELLLVDDAQSAPEPVRESEGTVASPAATGKLPVLEASFDAMTASLSLTDPVPAEPSVAAPSAPKAGAGPVPAKAVGSAPREAPLSLETTQTLRPLTPKEMQDAAALRWFVIQLTSSDQPFDPGTVPKLDIFLLYRLYSVASVDQGRPVHALRLGFFGEEMAAQAVASYLRSYYENPTVKRVSVAERERFSEHGIDARKDVGETGQHAAIELSTERPATKVELPPPQPAKPKPMQPTAAVRAAALRQISGQQPKKEKPAGMFASLPWIGRRK